MNDIQQMSVAMQQPVDFISMVTNKPLHVGKKVGTVI
jgi:hypothetical protein